MLGAVHHPSIFHRPEPSVHLQAPCDAGAALLRHIFPPPPAPRPLPTVQAKLLSEYSRSWRNDPAVLAAAVGGGAATSRRAGALAAVAEAAVQGGAATGAATVMMLSPVMPAAAFALASGCATAGGIISAVVLALQDLLPRPSHSATAITASRLSFFFAQVLGCGLFDEPRTVVERSIARKHTNFGSLDPTATAAAVAQQQAAYDDIVKAVVVYSQLRGWDEPTSFDSEDDRATVENTWAARQVAALKLAIDRA